MISSMPQDREVCNFAAPNLVAEIFLYTVFSCLGAALSGTSQDSSSSVIEAPGAIGSCFYILKSPDFLSNIESISKGKVHTTQLFLQYVTGSVALRVCTGQLP